MRNRSLFGLCVLLFLTTLAVPHVADAQPSQKNDRDSLWNGMLIGAGVGAAAGMLFAPQALCGSHDTECAVIVRAAIGLPGLAGGIGIGALIDGLMTRDETVPFGNTRAVKPKVSGVQLTLRF